MIKLFKIAKEKKTFLKVTVIVFKSYKKKIKKITIFRNTFFIITILKILIRFSKTFHR